MNSDVIDGDAVRGYMDTEMPAVVKHPLGTTPVTVILQNYTYKNAKMGVDGGQFYDMDDLVNTALVHFLATVRRREQ
ncbi:hypothetical protein [Methanococcoides sp. AM1]|uniref:hypothetical protein n=1 Tax=Methanococcoides sp. AM1 TaxID=1201011 RepID=UPI001083248C|nr:hypothetical protein [Methanococcoides sp. AM1]